MRFSAKITWLDWGTRCLDFGGEKCYLLRRGKCYFQIHLSSSRMFLAISGQGYKLIDLKTHKRCSYITTSFFFLMSQNNWSIGNTDLDRQSLITVFSNRPNDGCTDSDTLLWDNREPFEDLEGNTPWKTLLGSQKCFTSG